MRRICILLILACAARGLSAAEPPAKEPATPLEWSFGGELTLRPDRHSDRTGLYDLLGTSFRYRHGFLSLLADLSLVNDERYQPDEMYMLGRSFSIPNGGLELDFDILRLRAGRLTHRDILDIPYPLFISSADLSTLLVDLTFRGGPFTYESRWIQLTPPRSGQVWPERGANYKVFALELGDWRFGLQDAAVYYGRSFDPEYFLSPIPHIFTQMVTRQDVTPWQEEANDNSITGLFAEWRRPRRTLYAQWLVDDISLDFLIPWFLRDEWGDRTIANKMAWTLGGYWNLPFGRLGFHHAGATKFVFGPTYNDAPYGYTYFPATEYYLDPKDEERRVPLDYRDNYLGYHYGENNLAFRVDLQRPLLGADFGAALEYVLSGSKSPANAWHGEDDPNRTEMLDDPVLEHTVAAELSAAWPVGGWTFYTSLRLGGVFNRLELVDAPNSAEPRAQKLFRPQAGERDFLYRWTVGASWTWRPGSRPR